jgi:hypothetical protein
VDSVRIHENLKVKVKVKCTVLEYMRSKLKAKWTVSEYMRSKLKVKVPRNILESPEGVEL